MARWEVTLIRKKGENLGVMEAPDAASAVDQAAEAHNIAPSLRHKIVVTRIDPEPASKKKKMPRG